MDTARLMLRLAGEVHGRLNLKSHYKACATARQPGSPAVHRSQITEDQMPKQNDLTNELNTFIIVLNFEKRLNFFRGVGWGLKPVTKVVLDALRPKKKKSLRVGWPGTRVPGTARTGKVEIPKFSARDRADDKDSGTLSIRPKFSSENFIFPEAATRSQPKRDPNAGPLFLYAGTTGTHMCTGPGTPRTRVPANRLRLKYRNSAREAEQTTKFLVLFFSNTVNFSRGCYALTT